jgi:hypothetical protein
MLEEEFQYYKDNQDELLKKYKGRFIAIVGKEVVGDYDTFEEAVDQTIQVYELGKFLIQECTEGEESYTQTFQSRVVFA